MIFTIQTEGLNKEQILTLLNLKLRDLGNYMATLQQSEREFKQAEFMATQVEEVIKEVANMEGGEELQISDMVEDFLNPSY